MLRVLHIGFADDLPQTLYGNLFPEMTKRDILLTKIVYLPRRSDLKPAPYGEVEMHPTYSHSRLTFPIDALRVGSQLHLKNPFGLIVAEEPMGSGLAGYWLKKRFHIPLLIKCHTPYFQNTRWFFERPQNPVYYFLAIFLLCHSDMVQVESQLLAQSLMAIGISKRKIQVCPTPIKTNLFDEPPTFSDRPFQQKLLSVGRLISAKGVSNLLKAVHTLVDWRKDPKLVIAGEGPLRSPLEKQAVRLRIENRVSFRGFVSQQTLPSLYKECDVFVLPSLYDSRPKVLVEAALSGLPIITTRVGSVSDLVREEETALIVPPNDPKALARSICELIDDPNRARAMGLKGREFAHERFNRDKMKDAVAELWRKTAALKAR